MTIVINETSSRADIEQAIVQLSAKRDRMPAHWTDRRKEVADEIDALVDQWLAAEA